MYKKAKIKSIQNLTMITFKEERVKIKSNSPRKSMWITCTQKKVNIKSSPEHHDAHLHSEEGEDRVKIFPRKACESPVRRRR